MCPPSAFGHVDTVSAESSTSTSETTPDLPPNCVPQDTLSLGAFELARSSLPLAILNHSIRVYLYAKWIAEHERSPWAADDRLPLLFVACILHDVGCTSRFDGPQRFEVEGADAAASFLQQFNISTADVHEVWQAIALHTSPQIAERVSSLARLVRASVLLDFNELNAKAGKLLFDSISEPNGTIGAEVMRGTIEQAYPRLEPEKVLGDAVVAQALQQRGKAPASSWPGIMLKAALDEPEWKGINKAF